MQDETPLQQSADENDIEYTPTPTGFVMRASLSSYTSILMIVFIAVFVGIVYYKFDQFHYNAENATGVVVLFFAFFILCILLGVGLFRAVGTENFTMDIPNLEVGIGIGKLLIRYNIDVREIDSICIGPGMITDITPTGSIGTKDTPRNAILISLNKPQSGWNGSRDKYAFGHFMTKEQQNFVINRIKEAIEQSGMGNTTFREM